MLRNLNAVLEYGMYAGPVENNFQGSVSFYSTNEMCMKILGFVAFAGRNFLGRGIWTDMYKSRVRESVKNIVRVWKWRSCVQHMCR